MFRVLCSKCKNGNVLVFDDSDNTLEYASVLEVKTLQSQGYPIVMDLVYSDILDVLYLDVNFNYSSRQLFSESRLIAFKDIVNLLGFTFYEGVSICSGLFVNYECIYFISGCNFYSIAFNTVSKIAYLYVSEAFKSREDGLYVTIYKDGYLIRVKRGYFESGDLAVFNVTIEDDKFNIMRLS